MKIDYQIIPFKNIEERSEIIYKLLSQGGLRLEKRDKELLKFRGTKTLDTNKTLEEEFKEEINHPFFKGYNDCVDIYLKPYLKQPLLSSFKAMRTLSGTDIIFSGLISEINWDPRSSYAKGKMGGADLFIAFDLDKYNLKKSGIKEVVMGTKDDNSPLGLLEDADPVVLSNILNFAKSGSKRKNKINKRKKTKKRSKTKVQKKKKKSRK